MEKVLNSGTYVGNPFICILKKNFIIGDSASSSSRFGRNMVNVCFVKGRGHAGAGKEMLKFC
jgi:hypothetical protein